MSFLNLPWLSQIISLYLRPAFATVSRRRRASAFSSSLHWEWFTISSRVRTPPSSRNSIRYWSLRKCENTVPQSLTVQWSTETLKFTVVFNLTHWLDAERKIPIAFSWSPKDVPNMYLNIQWRTGSQVITESTQKQEPGGDLLPLRFQFIHFP